MREITADLWSFWKKRWIVVTTNIGYRPKVETGDTGALVGPAPMGAGLAKDLVARVPDVPYFYAHWCFKHKEHTPVMWDPRGFVLFPTKPLNAEKPWLSWQYKSNILLIERSLKELQAMELPDRDRLASLPKGVQVDPEEILVPLVGCKNGKLTESQVLPLMQKILDDRFVLVREPPAQHEF